MVVSHFEKLQESTAKAQHRKQIRITFIHEPEGKRRRFDRGPKFMHAQNTDIFRKTS
jgi:hypothetical protein